VTHVQFPLHPDTPPEGRDLATYFRARGFDVEAAHKRMAGLMAAEGLPFHPGMRAYNSRLAQELGKWGDAQGTVAIHDALYRAYFVDGKDISRVDELVAIAAGAGLPADEARRVLEERSFRDAVDADWERARELGVTGVPTYVCEGRGVVGAQPYEVLEQLVHAAGAQPSSTGHSG
jgi:predicted DsbA family dithiol-disulfide isomerase